MYGRRDMPPLEDLGEITNIYTYIYIYIYIYDLGFRASDLGLRAWQWNWGRSGLFFTITKPKQKKQP